PAPASPHTITAYYNGTSNFAISSGSINLIVNRAPLLVTANSATRVYGQANPAFTGILTGIQNNDAITATYSSAATASSPLGTYAITPILSDRGTGALANYIVTSNSGTLTVTPAPLTATGINFQAIAGAPFSGTVATFQNADPFGGITSYTAIITWGNGNSSAGTITDQGGGIFAVSGSNTYAD